jgi:hypothetical protein
MKSGISILFRIVILGASIKVSANVNTVADTRPSSPADTPTHAIFNPPADSAIPNDEFGRLVRLGRQIFTHPNQFAKPFVGNALARSAKRSSSRSLGTSACFALVAGGPSADKGGQCLLSLNFVQFARLIDEAATAPISVHDPTDGKRGAKPWRHAHGSTGTTRYRCSAGSEGILRFPINRGERAATYEPATPRPIITAGRRGGFRVLWN